MKVESHNHPSAVEPFQGAATGVGGIVRDIFTMGARPCVSLNSLRFGEIEGDANARQRFLFDGVVGGIAHYGNCLGIPTVGGEVYFEDSYAGNCLVNAMSAGLMRSDQIVRAIASGPGNHVVLIGSKTGRDGIGGASVLASQEFDERLEEKRPSVQVGDPFTEKKLIEACLELLHSATSSSACRTSAPPGSPARRARWPARALAASTSTPTACRCARPTWSPGRS